MNLRTAAAAAATTSASTADAATPAETRAETTSQTSVESAPTSHSTTSLSTSESTTSETTSSSTSSTSESTSSLTIPTEPTTTSSTSSTSPLTTQAPSTTSSTTSFTTASPDVVTTVVTQTPTDGATGVETLTITSTDTSVPNHTAATAADGLSTTASRSSETSSPGSSGSGSSGLSAGGTIAVAVVVPVASVAIIILAALYFWRKWKAKKAAEEERRKEVEEYGFNPNNDPSLPPVMGGGAFEPKDDTSGYRGWGTTSAGRKASTNLSSSAGVGLAMSEAGSAPGYHHAATPSDGTIQYSEGQGALEETEPIGVLGAAPVAAANNRNVDIHRGPSNASSAYSAANRSEASDESHMSATHPAGPFYDDNPYYTDMQPQYGAYGDSPYGGAPPVIRDVQARRNTRIESPAVFPRQGNAGIAQNF
ncbi:hypothetical protein BO70DRAFT_375321 [Aspergillus heteromorphus CBS 117.55]|uniref:Mid2 domain-containing protein n=1 Tax=Aspergillus heteromorphus CBS 117.55 TaxID=1448321 RepID=A0A317UU36_9EURO|nr:uncharacterized protein BO70DRAFT_375321 [Aspergillus heteromorphus CBS 117.55]PWY63550.1 hypothetical protein BO70DRAFT_375321 [Aspergillus heteromorphus CBS 117.55]